MPTNFRSLADQLRYKPAKELCQRFCELAADIQTAEEFNFVLEKLKEKQCTEAQRRDIYQILKNRLPSASEDANALIKNARDFSLVLEYLTDEERRETYQAHKLLFTTLIKNPRDFWYIGKFLPDDLKVDLYNHQKTHIQTNTLQEFNLVASVLPTEQQQELFAPYKADTEKLKTFLQHPQSTVYQIEQFSGFLQNSISPEEKVANSNPKARMDSISKIVNDIKEEKKEASRLRAQTRIDNPTVAVDNTTVLKMAIKIFVHIYAALRSMHWTTWFRSNKWKNLSDSSIDKLDQTAADSTWENIKNYANEKSTSRSNSAMQILQELKQDQSLSSYTDIKTLQQVSLESPETKQKTGLFSCFSHSKSKPALQEKINIVKKTLKLNT